jgi:hypothetical protein
MCDWVECSRRETGTCVVCHEQDKIRVISGFRREIAEECAVLGHYAANSSNYRRFGTTHRSQP